MIPPPTSLTLSPFVIATVAVPAAGVAAMQVTAWRRGHGVSGWRITALAAALVLLAGSLVSPLATTANHYLLASHMLQAIVVMGFVPPLLLLALPAHTPGRRRAPRALRAVMRFVAHPATAILLVNGAFFAWHSPLAFGAAAGDDRLFALQQATLLAVSLLFWWPIVQPPGRRPTMSPLVKLGYILLATIPQTFYGLVLALSHHTFYSAYDYSPRLFGLTVLTDQQISGALMALVSKLALFAAFSVVFWRLMSREDADYNGGDDGGRGDDDDAPLPVPSGAPAWLWMLERGWTVEEPDPFPSRTGVSGPRV